MRGHASAGHTDLECSSGPRSRSRDTKRMKLTTTWSLAYLIWGIAWDLLALFPTVWMARRRHKDPLWFVVLDVIGFGWIPFLYLWLGPGAVALGGRVWRRYLPEVEGTPRPRRRAGRR